MAISLNHSNEGSVLLEPLRSFIAVVGLAAGLVVVWALWRVVAAVRLAGGQGAARRLGCVQTHRAGRSGAGLAARRGLARVLPQLGQASGELVAVPDDPGELAG